MVRVSRELRDVVISAFTTSLRPFGEEMPLAFFLYVPRLYESCSHFLMYFICHSLRLCGTINIRKKGLVFYGKNKSKIY